MENKLVLILKKIGDVIIENKDYLTELDRVIGDGDHGTNLARGFEKVNQEIENMHDKSYAEILTKVAMVLISNVGGASGAIYGSAFLKAANFAKEKDFNDNQTIVAMWNEMILGIESRGNAKLGEKTMLDTIIPAFEAFKKSVNGGKSLKEAFAYAETKAKEGMEKTKTLVASKGRASYLGERSLNHIDPGAYSSYLIIKTVSELI